MKTYIVYIAGEDVGLIKANSHNQAESKAAEKFPNEPVSVCYTEVSDEDYEVNKIDNHKP